MMKKVMIICVLLMSTISLSACTKKCSDGIIDYVHALKWKDIHYTRNYQADISRLEKGNVIGEVAYMLSGDACPDYKRKTGTPRFCRKGRKFTR
jgi:hypothetical protein